MERSIYRESLENLKAVMADSKYEGSLSNFLKVITLAHLNLRWEQVAFTKDHAIHPYLSAKKIIEDTLTMFEQLNSLRAFEASSKIHKQKSEILEEKHQELWQEIWSRHNDQEFDEFIDLKLQRLKHSNLEKYIRGKDCVDFGCGNGSFLFATLKLGATSATGVDFGTKSVQYATEVARRRSLHNKCSFNIGKVTDTGLENNKFDFAISNGVFHHLKDKQQMFAALKEVNRVLKPGGWLWYYIDGKDAISMDFWDCSVEILSKVDVLFIENALKNLNLTRNKMVHLMDGLTATYLHSTYDETKSMLADAGFHNFSRLDGGYEYDLDPSRINEMKYGQEIFGEGDLRILAQKI